jgi:cardiolipin synthase (CMP-forming)
VQHLPNLISFGRILLIWPVLLSMRDGAYLLTLVWFVVAALSDGLDGFLAKRFNWTSALGRIVDPLADKLLLVTVFVYGAWLGLLPIWLAAAAVARDFVIGLGALVFRAWFGPLHGRPTVISKINTVLQLVFCSLAILFAARQIPPRELMDFLAIATLITTVASGAHYLLRFVQRVW